MPLPADADVRTYGPLEHPGIDMSDWLGHIKPSKSINLLYGSHDDDDDGHVEVGLSPLRDAVVLEHINTIINVDCGSKDDQALWVYFDSEEAVTAAVDHWSKPEDDNDDYLVMVTNHFGSCDEEFERGFFEVQYVIPDWDEKAVKCVASRRNVRDITETLELSINSVPAGPISKRSPERPGWESGNGLYKPSKDNDNERPKTWPNGGLDDGDPTGRGPDPNFKEDMAGSHMLSWGSNPGGEKFHPFGMNEWHPNGSKEFSLDFGTFKGLNIDTSWLDIGIEIRELWMKARVTYSGYIRYSAFKGLEEGYIKLDTNFHAKIEIEAILKAEYTKNVLQDIKLPSLGISYFEIPMIVSLGPSVRFYVGLDFGAKAEIDIVAGLELEIPHGIIHINMKDPGLVSVPFDTWKPELTTPRLELRETLELKIKPKAGATVSMACIIFSGLLDLSVGVSAEVGMLNTFTINAAQEWDPDAGNMTQSDADPDVECDQGVSIRSDFVFDITAMATMWFEWPLYNLDIPLFNTCLSNLAAALENLDVGLLFDQAGAGHNGWAQARKGKDLSLIPFHGD
ncbi:isoamyl alcohol [Zalerion maritima]|uniref:Isoamyl alcohol n=1 Tax=Zalerion maritima TaxID=339359 RepID=A0AAD5RVY4_9PEZI|nr:isoamyl alcohol [Zalerion maritima]